MLKTIRAKLLFLLVIFLATTGGLTYLLISNTSGAQKVASKIDSIGEARALSAMLGTYARGYQLSFDTKNYEGYFKTDKDFIEHIDKIQQTTRETTQLALLDSIRKEAVNYKMANETRFKIIKEHTYRIHTSEFINTKDGQLFKQLNNEAAEHYFKLQEMIEQLTTKVEESEFAILENAKTTGIVTSTILAIIVTLLFLFIISKIRLSIEKASEGCSYIAQNKDLHYKIETGDNDEIAHMMGIFNALLAQLAKAIDEANRALMKMLLWQKSFQAHHFILVEALKIPHAKSKKQPKQLKRLSPF